MCSARPRKEQPLPERHTSPAPAADGIDELEQTYEKYRDDPRKRRKWNADNLGNAAIRAELLQALTEIGGPRLAGDDILDIGCGGGWLLEALFRRGVPPSRLHGVDALQTRVTGAAARVPGCEVQVADARRLPFESGRFGLVTLITVLSSMPGRSEVAAALREARRVTHRDGLVLCYEPRLPNPFNRNTRRISAGEVEGELRSAAAERRLTGVPFVARRLGAATSRAYPLLARLAATHRLTAHAGGDAPRSRE